MGLFLSALNLSHFRSHKVGRLDLDGRPVVLFGANGSGKNNVLEAVSLFSPGRGLRRSSAEDMVRCPEKLGWKLSGVLRSQKKLHEIEIWSENGAARKVRINDKAASQLDLGRIARVLWLIPAMDRLWVDGAAGRRRFLDRVTLSFEPKHAVATLAYERAMRERNRLLKDMVRDSAWYTALERQMAKAGVIIDANRRAALAQLAKAQMGAQTIFPTAELTLTQTEGPMPEAADDFLTALADNRSREIAAGRSLIGPHRTDILGVYAAKGVAAKDCSTGEQKALLVSLILANARALARIVGAPPLLLLDEVAAHLDFERRTALYDEISALGAQAWMTGTEEELFAAMGSRAQYVEVRDSNGLSELVTRA